MAGTIVFNISDISSFSIYKKKANKEDFTLPRWPFIVDVKIIMLPYYLVSIISAVSAVLAVFGFVAFLVLFGAKCLIVVIM